MTIAYPDQLTLVAFIQAKPGLGDELGRCLLTLVDPARAEAGNLNYDLHRSETDPEIWMLYENWKSPAELDAHFALPYMQRFVAGLGELLDGPWSLQRFAMASKPAISPSKNAA